MDYFDANCFVGRWTTDACGCADTSALRAEMARLGITRALVRHSWGRLHDAAVGNAELLRLALGEPGLVPCLTATALVDEELGGIDSFMAQVRESGAGAVCLYPREHSYTLAPWNVGELLEALQAQSVPLLLEMEETTWTDVASVLTNWPELPLIVARTGYRVLRCLLPLMRAHSNLYADLAYLGDNEAVEVLVAAVGAERLLFGTGTPRTDGSGALGRLAYAAIDESARELIAAGNLDRLVAGIRATA